MVTQLFIKAFKSVLCKNRSRGVFRKMRWVVTADLAPQEPAVVHSIAEKTLDASQFLGDGVRVALGDFKRIDEKVILIYHIYCPLNRSLGITRQAESFSRANGRRLLRDYGGCHGLWLQCKLQSGALEHYKILFAIEFYVESLNEG